MKTATAFALLLLFLLNPLKAQTDNFPEETIQTIDRTGKIDTIKIVYEYINEYGWIRSARGYLVERRKQPGGKRCIVDVLDEGMKPEEKSIFMLKKFEWIDY